MVKQPEWETFNFPNLQLYGAKLPKRVINRLWGYIDKAKDRCNDQLAGNLDTSLYLNDTNDYFFKFINPLLKEWERNLFYDIDTYGPAGYLAREKRKLKLTAFWVNFQNQLEFNPSHFHTGLLSFVIWMKMPVEWKDKNNFPVYLQNSHKQNPATRDFELIYSDILGSHRTFSIEQFGNNGEMVGKEGRMLLFPAQMRHQVHPFHNCDEQRISISGNISWVAE